MAETVSSILTFIKVQYNPYFYINRMTYIFSYSLPSNKMKYDLRLIGGPMKLTAKFVENVTEAR